MAPGDEEVAVRSNDTISRDDIESTSPDEYDRRQSEQHEIFEKLRFRIRELLGRFGRPDYLSGQPEGDYCVHGDYSEDPQVVVFIHNLEFLRQPVVSALQSLLKDFPGWRIDVMVGLWDHLNDWPNMGISIRQNEIVDDLQRQYFPEGLQDLTYEGATRGSVRD